MNDHLTLVNAHFNLTGGRRQDFAETFRVLPVLQVGSDHKAAFYAVTEASAPGPMGARARRLVIDIIQHEYSLRLDTLPAARLKRAASVASDELYREFDGHVRVGLSAVVAEGRTVYLLQVPPAQTYVLHEESLHSVSSNLVNESAPFAQALGSSHPPSISVYRDHVEAGDVIVLCTTWFARELSSDELRTAFGVEDSESIAANLLAAAQAHQAREATCVVLQAVPELEAKSGIKSDELGSSLLGYLGEARDALANVGRFLAEELRPAQPPQPASDSSAVTTAKEPISSSPPSPPLVPEPEKGAPPHDPTALSTSSETHQIKSSLSHPYNDRDQGTEEIPIVRHVSGTPDEGKLPPPHQEAAHKPLDEPDKPLPASTGRHATADLEEINSFIRHAPNLGKVAPPIQAFPDTNVAPERIYPRTEPLRRDRRRPRRFGGVIRPGRREPPLYADVAVLQPRIKDIDMGRPAFDIGKIPPALILWSSAALVLVILAIAAFMFVFRSHHAAVPNYLRKASYHVAQALASKNPVYQNQQLALAQQDLVLARKNGFPPRQIATTAAYVQSAADSIRHIVRIQNPTIVTNLSRFPNSHPQQLAGGAGVLYVLDSGRRFLYSVALNRSVTISSVDQPGDVINGLTWGVPEQLVADGPTMLAIDQNNIVLSYNTVNGRNALQLNAPPNNPRIVSMATFGSNLYLLDANAGQIWKYIGNGSGGYYPAPMPYLAQPDPSDFSRAVSLAIDGDVYVGLSGGRVLKYTAGKPDPFTISLPPPLPALVHISQIYTRPDLYALFIADPFDHRILQIGKHGRYLRTFLLSSSLAQGFRQMTVSADGHTVYLLSGQRIVSFTIPR